MTAATWTAIDKRLSRLAGRIAPPVAPRSALELAADLGLALDPWQREVLISDARQIALLVSRQGGKSTVAALTGLHQALSEPNSLILILSPTERQAKLLFRTIAAFYARLTDTVPADVENRLSLELRNGSAIHALPSNESGVRGFSAVRLLIVDEASRVPDELYQAIRPMLAVSGGRIVLLSTPWGKRGFFHREWTEGADWHRVQLTAYDCPRIPVDWLERERLTTPTFWFRQEFLVEFVDADDQFFATDLVMGIVQPGARALFGL